jgi:hypothetical protein
MVFYKYCLKSLCLHHGYNGYFMVDFSFYKSYRYYIIIKQNIAMNKIDGQTNIL